eukprot:TRINITY_DN6124_c0_g1_i1.p1 TRINITY_DN6124_c0_g1~~TRINITY_DN6124_c0_g1_i1.p1  ORF type:complete len:860 (+),score=223.91 TRINITY_DN6124_c0_g1_i1:84-2582(+)
MAAAEPAVTLRACHLSLAAYERTEALEEWAKSGKGGRILLRETKPVFAAECCDYRVIKVVCQEADAADEHKYYHKCQWVAAAAEDLPGTVFVAFRGTDSAIDALLDVSITDVETVAGARVHAGFYAGVQHELKDVLAVLHAEAQSGLERVVFCGHSLGGAYATVALAELPAQTCWPRTKGGEAVPVEAVTFGSPLVFTEQQGSLRLPHWPASAAPRLTNVVYGFDIVPRGFCLRKQALQQVVRDLPHIAGAGGVVSWSAKLGFDPLAQVVRLTEALEPLRQSYTPVGTYVFVASAVLPDTSEGSPAGMAVRRSYCAVIPGAWEPNHAAAAALRYFPAFDPEVPCAQDCSETLHRTALLSGAIADHSVSMGYMHSVEHVTSGDEWRRALDAAPQAGRATSLRAWSPGAAVRQLAAALPPEVEQKLDKARLQRVREELAALQKQVDEAYASAVASLPAPVPPPGPVPRDAAAADAVELADKETPRPEPAKAKSAWGLGNSDAAPPAYLVNCCGAPVTVKVTPQKRTGEQEAAAPFEHTVEPSGKGQALHLDPKLIAPGDAVELTCGSETASIQVPKAAARPGTRVLVAERSDILGLVLWDAGVRKRPDGARDGTAAEASPTAGAGPFWQPDEGGRRIDAEMMWPQPPFFKPLGEKVLQAPRLAQLHKFANYLAAQAHRPYGLCDRRPRGFLLPKAHWRDADKCIRCDTAFGGFLGMGKGQHHCRSCGGCVCEKCLLVGAGWLLQLLPDDPKKEKEREKICKSCVQHLAPLYRSKDVVHADLVGVASAAGAAEAAAEQEQQERSSRGDETAAPQGSQPQWSSPANPAPAKKRGFW